MSNSTGKYVILFEEGPGYILSRSLSEGSQAQVHLVISLKDGKSYVRKKLNIGESFRELPKHHLPVSMVPELISITGFPKPKGNTAIFRYCNGGDLLCFQRKFTNVGANMPEVMFWVVIKKICEILAYVQHGWRCDASVVTMEKEWHPFMHNDLHEGNIFLHWEDENNLLPSVLLGDWGCSSVVEGPADENGRVVVDPKTLDYDLAHFIHKLRKLSDECSPDVKRKEGPLFQLQQLRREAKQLARGNNDMKVTQHVAEIICPMAEQMIKKLQDEDPVDLRWTRSLDPARALSFEGGEQRRGDMLYRWARAENHRRLLEKPWIWMEVDRLPRNIPWQIYEPPEESI